MSSYKSTILQFDCSQPSIFSNHSSIVSTLKTNRMRSEGGSLFPCSLPKLPYVPMFPHSLRMFSYCNFSKFLFPCSQKLANVPLFPSIFCQCSLVPQNPWETLRSSCTQVTKRREGVGCSHDVRHIGGAKTMKSPIGEGN